MINIPYPTQEILDEYFDSIKDSLLKRIKTIKNDKKIKRNNKTYKVTKQIYKVLAWLEDESNLKKVILAKPKLIVKIVQKVEKDFKKARYSKEALNNVLYRVFVDYGYDRIDKLKFIKNIGLGSCPYCNRNYIFTVNRKGSVKPEIDHFFPKSYYPYLGVSYFNLIPSCPTCNGFGAKEAKDTFYVHPINHPYETKANDFMFSISPNNINFLEVEKTNYNFNDFEIELYGNKDSLEVFKLEELYKQHKDIVLELLVKKVYYPRSYIKELAKFGFSQDEIYRYLFSNYRQDEDLHKRPLSKLIKDITEELGIV